MKTALIVATLLLPMAAGAVARPVEMYHVLGPPSTEGKVVALTVDACGGAYDASILEFLVEQRIPATVFATRRSLRSRSGAAIADIKVVYSVEIRDWEAIDTNKNDRISPEKRRLTLRECGRGKRPGIISKEGVVPL